MSNQQSLKKTVSVIVRDVPRRKYGSYHFLMRIRICRHNLTHLVGFWSKFLFHGFHCSAVLGRGTWQSRCLTNICHLFIWMILRPCRVCASAFFVKWGSGSPRNGKITHENHAKPLGQKYIHAQELCI